MKLIKSIEFSDGCSITLNTAHEVSIDAQGECHHFSDENKPVFDYGTGEIVSEYSGRAVGDSEKRSWAIARYKPGAQAPLHLHEVGIEDYYIIRGSATVRVDDSEFSLSAGDHLQIKPGQQHQVFNHSDEELALIVKCVPAWTKEDFHIVDEFQPSSRIGLL